MHGNNIFIYPLDITIITLCQTNSYQCHVEIAKIMWFAKKKKKKKRGRYGYYFNVDGHSFLTDPLLSITKILSTT